jgi:4-hydroxy-2-oxoheptanedioate aldolase
MDALEPKAQQAVEHILARARHHGVIAGIHNAGPASALNRIGMGFQFVTVGSDAKFIAEGAQQVMSAMRAGQTAARPSSGY